MSIRKGDGVSLKVNRKQNKRSNKKNGLPEGILSETPPPTPLTLFYMWDLGEVRVCIEFRN